MTRNVLTFTKMENDIFFFTEYDMPILSPVIILLVVNVLIYWLFCTCKQNHIGLQKVT